MYRIETHLHTTYILPLRLAWRRGHYEVLYRVRL